MSSYPSEKKTSQPSSVLDVVVYDTDMAVPPALDMSITQVNDAANASARVEIEQTIWQAVKSCKMGLFWCFFISMAVLMEGYDMALLGNFMAFPQFAKRYGHYVAKSDDYQLEAKWQAALNNGSGIGAFFGTLINGVLVAKYGHRRVLIGALIMLSACIFITFFATSVVMLLIGQLLCGLPWGVFATTAPAYASEVLPLNLRVYMTSWTNMCFVIGQLIASGVLAGLVNYESEWAYRIPFALQWVWPMIIVPVLFFAPDSPWHLVRQGRHQQAEDSLRRLWSKETPPEHIKATLAAITKTNAVEEEMQIGTSYGDCFKGAELRRTEIACMAFAGQVLSGSSFAYNSTYFFQQVGLSSEQTYHLGVGGTGMALVACFCSWFFVMPYLGRRPTYIAGMATCATILFVIGILNTHTNNNSVGLTQAILTLVWTFVFQLSMGQLGWAIPAEIGSTRLRQKTICIARNAYYIISVISQVVQPYFLNPSALNLRGYTGFIWGTTAFLTLIWAIFRLPESKDRTYEQLDILFANKTPAHKFKSTHVDTSTVDPAIKAVIASQIEKSV